jgi:hypothetical protein
LYPRQRIDSQESGIEAKIIKIPNNNKFKVLSRICPPLAPLGPASPVNEVRGAIIAVEGTEPHLVAEVGNFIGDHLSKEAEYIIKSFSAPVENAAPRDSMVEVQMIDADMRTFNSPKIPSPFMKYLNIIQYWHEKSEEIIKFITTTPPPALSHGASLSSKPISPTATTAPSPKPITSPPESVPVDNSIPPAISTTGTSNHVDPNPAVPIALLPYGFSLTISDQAAISIPINDAYAPVDHWQWMATLWRGIVGPDLVIYVKSVLLPTTTTPGDKEAMEEMSRNGVVEVRREREDSARIVVVRVPIREDRASTAGVAGGYDGMNGEGSLGAAGRGKAQEATLRRLGFEVLEIVRGGFRKASGSGIFDRG